MAKFLPSSTIAWETNCRPQYTPTFSALPVSRIVEPRNKRYDLRLGDPKISSVLPWDLALWCILLVCAESRPGVDPTVWTSATADSISIGQPDEKINIFLNEQILPNGHKWKDATAKCLRQKYSGMEENACFIHFRRNSIESWTKNSKRFICG